MEIKDNSKGIIIIIKKLLVNLRKLRLVKILFNINL